MGMFKNVATSGMLFWFPILARALLQSVQQHGAGASTTSSHTAASQPPFHIWPDKSEAAAHGDAWNSSRAALVSSIPFICAALMALWLGHHSQQRNERSLHLAVPYLISSILFASFPKLATHSIFLAFAALSVVIACLQGSNSIINSFIPGVCVWGGGGGSSINLLIPGVCVGGGAERGGRGSVMNTYIPGVCVGGSCLRLLPLLTLPLLPIPPSTLLPFLPLLSPAAPADPALLRLL